MAGINFKREKVTIVSWNLKTLTQYIHPDTDASVLSNCDLLVIDEAAAIPLPLVQKLVGSREKACNYLIFMSSTVNGLVHYYLS